MMWNESPKLKVVALGAVNGIIFGTLLETILRSIYAYEKYLRSLQPPSDFCISSSPYSFSWWFLPLSFFVCVAVATFITHQFFAKYVKSSVWFWQTVGIIAAFNCALFSVFYVLYHHYFSEFGLEHTGLIMSDIQADLFMILIIYPAIAAFNLIFALILKRRNLNFS